ncbi:molecular chaperone SurA [Thioflexithrix psekupsensis]|uniref:Chaperone SurA n=1 Tax=Thioflexithrix psekupsensis TaxID=1570016 RepID=A0A251X996_9GAMM|nr:molecular chaperone SurA [Thioflexithrix psekupsensis]
MTAQTTPQTLDYIVTVVNEEVITHSELQEQLRKAQTRLEQQGIRIPPDADLERQVLESMIMNTLQLQLATRTNVEVDDLTLNEALRNLASQQNMTLDELRDSIESSGFSYANFREDIRDELLIRRLQQRQVVSRINITDKEIDNFLVNQVQQGAIASEYRLFHILIATPEAASPEVIAAKKSQAETILSQLQQGADFQEMAVRVSDGQQALEGGDLGWRSAAQLPSLFLESVLSLSVGEASPLIRNAGGFHIIKLADMRGGKQLVTQTKARHILLKTNELLSDREAERQLSALKYRLEQGEDFAQLARATSTDLGSAAEGGDLGWVTPGDMVAEFETVMDSLAEGQISDPFKSRFGWHLVLVEQRREHDNTDQARRTEAARQIRERKIEEELNTWMRQLRDEAYVEYRLKNESQ